MRALLALIAAILATAASATDGPVIGVFRQVAGEIREVQVASGDTLIGIAAHLGVPWRTLAARNKIANPDRIYEGQSLHVDTRRIVPNLIDEGLVVNVPEATAYLFEAGNLAARYAVGLGRPSWPTPIGSLKVLAKENDPSWEVPSSIQEEMQREGRIVVKKMPPGPDNPLGKYWIQLSIWGYGIHGTPFPASIGRFLSHGCIRVGNWGIEDLYVRMQEGTRVEISYLPVKLAVTPKGEIWAEAHPDAYGLGKGTLDDAVAVLEREGVADRVDVAALEEVLRERLGEGRSVGQAAVGANNRAPEPSGEDEGVAFWRCLDCPPGPNRRVNFQIEARKPIDLPNPFPIEIRDDADRVVFQPQMVAQTIVHLDAGESRNFVWEVRSTEGQPLTPGSYTAVIRFFRPGTSDLLTLGLPLWVGN